VRVDLRLVSLVVWYCLTVYTVCAVVVSWLHFSFPQSLVLLMMLMMMMMMMMMMMVVIMITSRAYTSTKAQPSPIITIEQTPSKTYPVLWVGLGHNLTVTQS